MSFLWTAIAVFLYAEIGMVTILLLPFPPTMWKKIFNWRWFTWFSAHANFYFMSFLVLLSVLFIDSIREMQKHDVGGEVNLAVIPAAEHNSRVKYFRAQRNFWITGFTLFLWMVLKRLCVLISKEADLTEDVYQNQEALTKTKADLDKKDTELAIRRKEAQAHQNTESEMAKLQEQVQELKKSETEVVDLQKKVEDMDKYKSEVTVLKGRVEELEMCESEAATLKNEVTELKKSETELEAVKQQVENNKQAYDELLEEHRKLQEKCNAAEETKKDD